MPIYQTETRDEFDGETALTVLDALDTEVVVVNDGDAIVYANARALRLLGLADVEQAGSLAFSALWMEPAGIVRSLYKRLAGASTWMPFSLRLRHLPDAAVPMRGRAIKVGSDEKIQRAVLLVSDSSRSLMFAQNQALVARLNRELVYRRRSEAELRQISQRSANLHLELIHRVKNNLALLLSVLRLSKKRVNSGDPADALDALQSFEHRLMSIASVHQVLDYLQNTEAVRVDEMAQRICEGVQYSLGRSQVKVLCRAEPLVVPVEAATPLGLLVNEALTNAYYHGNLEISSEVRERDAREYHDLALQRRQVAPYAERRIHVRLHLDRDQLSITIRDEGPGFDPESLPDPTAPGYLERPCGRGVLLMRAFMDFVSFNEAGNEVTLVKQTRGVSETEPVPELTE